MFAQPSSESSLERLQGLRDKDTVVRWSSAKGLGRVAARLPQELGDELVGAALELMTDAEADAAWHGACIALAEMARRGLLLPHRLDEACPLVSRALHYDVRRGPHSVGIHVRDAAAYVCWALARAYPPHLLRAVVERLAPDMVSGYFGTSPATLSARVFRPRFP